MHRPQHACKMLEMTAFTSCDSHGELFIGDGRGVRHIRCNARGGSCHGETRGWSLLLRAIVHKHFLAMCWDDDFTALVVAD